MCERKLKPCPFCGNYKIKLETWYGRGVTFSVWCLNCRAQTEVKGTKLAAINRWNRRAKPNG